MTWDTALLETIGFLFGAWVVGFGSGYLFLTVKKALDLI